LGHGDATVAYPDVLDYLARHGDTSPTLRSVRDAVLEIRKTKGMVLDPEDADTRSVGSFFTNPVVAEHTVGDLTTRTGRRVPAYPVGPGMLKVPAAWLLEQAGFSRGYGMGAVGLSSRHPLAIINRGDGAARAVVALAVEIKRRVAERFGVSLVPEPSFVGFGDDEDIRYLVSGRGTP
jgi:UDP-N-acetylmuramate dehydrogenase